MALRVIITGATGMIGQAVLLECLDNPAVEKVLSIGRGSTEIEHPKLEELIHIDFTDFSSAQESISAFNPGACFHCMGVSSVGMKETDYSRLTYDVTKSLADAVYTANYRSVFIYVSGAGTDSSEEGRIMWARVKGRAENYIFNRGFSAAYAFRIGAVVPKRGVKSKSGWVNTLYTITKPIHSLLAGMDSFISSVQVGKAMINAARTQVQGKVLNNKEIAALA